MQKSNLKLVTELRHELHAHPEISGQEVETKRRLMSFLAEHTSFVIHDEGSWFWVKVPGTDPAQPSIGFRADYDALPIPEDLDLPYASKNPGVSHKCGHDGHSSALAGLALELEGRDVPSDVYLIFQPAEETGAGGFPSSRLIEREAIDQIYAFHNWSGIPRGCVALKRGVSQCASQGLSLEFKGITTHASNPEAGVNPSETIAQLVLYVMDLAGVARLGNRHSCFEGFVLATVVGIEVGRKDFGISASHGELNLTLRAENESDLAKLKSLICDEASHLAKQTSLLLSITDCDVFPETCNDDAAIDLVAAAAQRAGLPVVYLEKPYRASEDFGHYLKLASGAMVYIGNGQDWPPLHTSAYDFLDSNLEVAVDLWLSILGF